MTYRAIGSDQGTGRLAGSVPEVEWPVRTGRIPAFASDPFVLRPETGHGVDISRTRESVPPDPGARPAMTLLTGSSGSGKTQLAAACIAVQSQSGASDLLAWISAPSPSAVIAAYAQAALDLRLTGRGAPTEASAARFRDWLGNTDRRWTVIFDNVMDLAVLRGLWPAGSNGQVLVTCHPTIHASDLAQLSDYQPTIYRIDPFSPREALGYLAIRLHSDVDVRAQAVDLAADLGYLPLAMKLAASTMVGASMSCRDYRVRFAERGQELVRFSAQGPLSAVEVAWTLALDQADLLPPVGLARAVLILLALLDEGGAPVQIPMSAAACRYIETCTGSRIVDPGQVRAAILNLARFSVVHVDQSALLVEVHPTIRAAVERFMPPSVLRAGACAAADAMLEVGPHLVTEPAARSALADSVAGLGRVAGELLWRPSPHAVLMTTGASLDDAGLSGPAVDYWQSLLESSERISGTDSIDTLAICDRLADALAAARRVDEALKLTVVSLATRERIHGPHHQDTLATRAALARFYRAAELLDEAIDMAERVAADMAWVLGADDHQTLVARRYLASCRLRAGQVGQAIDLYQANIADWERVVGTDHQEVLDEYTNLGHAYQSGGKPDAAIAVFRKVRALSEQKLGLEDPQTLTATANLAFAYRTTGRMKDAIPCYRQVLAGREAALGGDDLDTLTAVANLASCYHSAHRMKDAIPLYERAFADRERIQGPDHPDTLTAQGNLAGGYHSAGRMADALPVYERTLADFERVFGPEHPDTLISRANLANAYHMARRGSEAIAVFERALADAERALGPDHQLTRTIRNNFRIAAQLTKKLTAGLRQIWINVRSNGSCWALWRAIKRRGFRVTDLHPLAEW